MQLSPSSPQLPPPPVPPDALDSDAARKRLLVTSAVLIVLLILLLLLMIWLLSTNGGGGLGVGGGGGGDTSGLLGAGGGDSTAMSNKPPSSFGNTEGSAAGDNAQAKPEAKSTTDSPSGTGSAPEAAPGDAAGGSEDSLTIYTPTEKAKPVVPSTVNNPVPPNGGAAGAGKGYLANLSGASNPFIGSGPRAKSTIYVVDASNSMLQGNRQGLVNQSLIAAIKDLKTEQKFKVYFFADHFVTDNISKGLMAASKNNKEKVINWIENIGTNGGTRPLAAILAALELRPERIIVMSDGQFDGSIVGTITKANPGKKTKIDCIGMDEEIETLKRIADENGGYYSQVASLPGK